MGTIEFAGVSLTFPNAKRATLRDCSFTIAAGEFVAILGPSGCGKTTLLKTVNRLYEPTAGTITLDGTNIAQLPVTQLRRRIGYVIQKAGLFPHMSVAENIAIVPKLLGWSRSRYQARTNELLHLVELPPQDYRDRYPAQLSGGQQQRVGIARALAANPEVLLMDEPFGALDAITRASLQAEVARLQSQLHKTILFVSHDVEEALLLADRILILRAGEIAQFDTPQNILLQPANAFVRDLVGASDCLRQLGVLPISLAINDLQLPEQNTPKIALEEANNLRAALSIMLATGASELSVTRAENVIGTLSFERLRLALRDRRSSQKID